MNTLLSIETRNTVLLKMAVLLEREREAIIAINKTDLEAYNGDDISMFDRLKVDDSKVDEMIKSVTHLASQDDPVGVERFSFKHDNGMQVYNKTQYCRCLRQRSDSELLYCCHYCPAICPVYYCQRQSGN